MGKKGKVRVPSLADSTLRHIDGHLYADSATGMVLSRVGRIHQDAGYEKVNINGRETGAHRLVYEACVGPIPPGLTINHIDGDKLNNHPSNLEPATMSEQIRHAYRIGLMTGNHRKGKKLGSKVSPEAIERLRNAGPGETRGIADELGINLTYAYEIRRGAKLAAH